MTISNARYYPSEICIACGNKYGRCPEGHVATFHTGKCGWCGETKPVTEPRDFLFPKWPIETEK